MDDPMGVGCLDCGRDLQCQGHRLVGGEWASDRSAVDILHDQVIGTDIVELTDIRVIQSRNGAHLPLKPLRELRTRNLDGNQPVQARVARLVDLAHPPDVDQGKDLVRAQPITRCHSPR